MVNKTQFLNNLCYTKLGYKRINKKLKKDFSRREIEDFIFKILNETVINSFFKIGKNFYVINKKYGIKVTINSNTFRIITVDRI
jgi:hypothetical protein